MLSLLDVSVPSLHLFPLLILSGNVQASVRALVTGAVLSSQRHAEVAVF